MNRRQTAASTSGVFMKLSVLHLGVEMPVRLGFGGRAVEIVEIVDQWYGSDYCYFKIKGSDGNLYILRFDEGNAEWELTMFQSRVAIRRSSIQGGRLVICLLESVDDGVGA
jgi:hypothetical protein